MTKRTLLYWIAVVVVAVTYLVAAGANADIGSRSECVGLASLPHWLDSDCKAALVPRLLILVVGAVPTFILIYFAEKDQERSSTVVGHGLITGGHEVEYKLGYGLCLEDGCNFRCFARNDAYNHRLTTGGVLQDPADESRELGSTPGLVTPTAPTTTAGDTSVEPHATGVFKICPDCAEEVRGAARKCRFCGYIFEGSRAG